MGAAQHIPQLVGKNAAVPQRSAGNILGGCLCVRLFLEGLDRTDRTGAFRDDIPILLAGVGGFDTHQRQAGVSFRSQTGEFFQRLKIVVVHIGVHRADDGGLLRRDPLHVAQIGAGQGDGGEGIPAAGLHADAHRVAQLVVDGADLGLAGGNGHVGAAVDLGDLAVDTLDHRLVAVAGLENFDELFGADVVGQRPQAFAGTAGEQDDIHSAFPFRGAQRSARMGLCRKSS